MKKYLTIITVVLFFSCDVTEPDTTPPTVTITFPINESTLTEISTIKVNASDNEEIVNVTFIIDGLTIYEDSQSPFEFEWDICAYDNTQHTLLVEAKDESGNVGESDLMTFTTNAVYDCADVCAGTSEILIYWIDLDGDNLGTGEPSEFCDVLVDEGWVLNNNDVDDNCLSNNIDCTDVCDGDALEDMCGICDNLSSNDCIQDCNGVWGGTHWVSECGCVSINNTGDDCDDCNGIPYGDAQIDCLGECDGDAEILTYWWDGDGDGLGTGDSSDFCNSLVEEGWVLNNNDSDDNCLSNVHDCVGICDGNSLEDNCGVCDSGGIPFFV